MIAPAYCRTMAAYNRWMNDKLYAVCKQVPDAQRREDRGAFFRSIHGTLNHLLYGDRAWMQRFTGDVFDGEMGEPLYDDFDELRHERARTDARIVEWAAGLTEADLSAPMHYRSSVYDIDREFPTWPFVVHMFNHQTHHRGQITTLLTQLGHDIGPTDLPAMTGLDQIIDSHGN